MKVFVFPGQGSQFLGMGETLFRDYPDHVRLASETLGYGVDELCLHDPRRELSSTQFTQPAIYTVNALSYLHRCETDREPPEYLAGHSLGEYSALFAAGAFDFATGLRIVQRRGELMSRSPDGAMAAVLGASSAQVEEVLTEAGVDDIDIANYNSPIQTVLAGPTAAIRSAERLFDNTSWNYIPLNVSSAFHSRSMRWMADEFRAFLKQFDFSGLSLPVIANASARPYRDSAIIDNLVAQVYQPVRWVDSIRYLMGKGWIKLYEIGPGEVLTNMSTAIIEQCDPIFDDEAQSPPQPARVGQPEAVGSLPEGKVSPLRSPKAPSTGELAASSAGPESLGSPNFREAYGVRYAYMSGGMYRGIASPELVIRMASSGLLSILGAGGLELQEIAAAIGRIRSSVQNGAAFGVNVISDPQMESRVIDLCLQNDVRVIEASAFMKLSPSVVRYRVGGLSSGPHGEIVTKHKVIAKVSRPEVAELFLSPPPEPMVEALRKHGAITAEQAELARRVPMAEDLTVESDSGGHTDAAVALVLLPTLIRLRDRLQERLAQPTRIGAAGGLGTPESIASVFLMGADYVVTGSVNQCTVESGASEVVKDLLQEMNVQDTTYAPAADLFELGARVQVMKKGVFFPTRANRLYDLWRHYDAWEHIDQKTRAQVEKYFGRTFDDIYQELVDKYDTGTMHRLTPKQRMAYVFRWYLGASSYWANVGDLARRVDYQVHTGPAIGAFNQWVKGTPLEDWRNRHVDEIAERLMRGAAEVLLGGREPQRTPSGELADERSA